MIYATEQQIVVTSGIVVIVGLVALCIGIWWGIGRGWREAEEDARWAREQAKARRIHPVYRTLPDGFGRTTRQPDNTETEVLAPTAVIPPDPDASVTAWTKAMAADMDRFIASLIEDTDEQLKEITR